MKEMIIKVEGYKTVAHVYTVVEGHYMVVINSKVTNIGGATLKGVLANTRRAIKRRGQPLQCVHCGRAVYVHTQRTYVRLGGADEHMFVIQGIQVYIHPLQRYV